MKPLQILSAAGNPANSVMVQLANIANRAFLDLPFHLVSTVIYFAPLSDLHPHNVVSNVSMVFEADSQADIDRFVERATQDPELRPLIGLPNKMQPVR